MLRTYYRSCTGLSERADGGVGPGIQHNRSAEIEFLVEAGALLAGTRLLRPMVECVSKKKKKKKKGRFFGQAVSHTQRSCWVCSMHTHSHEFISLLFKW